MMECEQDETSVAIDLNTDTSSESEDESDNQHINQRESIENRERVHSCVAPNYIKQAAVDFELYSESKGVADVILYKPGINLRKYGWIPMTVASKDRKEELSGNPYLHYKFIQHPYQMNSVIVFIKPNEKVLSWTPKVQPMHSRLTESHMLCR